MAERFNATPSDGDLHIGRFRVHLVFPGDAYGRDGCLTYEQTDADKYNGGGPLIEFYDESQDDFHFPNGQFVSRYYSETMAAHAKGYGLDLHGGVPAWKLDAAQVDAVRSWMQERIQAHGEKAPRALKDARLNVRDEGKAATDAVKALRERSHARDDHDFKTYGIER